MNWNERIATISINPDMADRDDVARLAADLMEARALLGKAGALFEKLLADFKERKGPTYCDYHDGHDGSAEDCDCECAALSDMIDLVEKKRIDWWEEV